MSVLPEDLERSPSAETGARVPTNSAASCWAERRDPGVQRMYSLRQAISAISELRPASISSKSPLDVAKRVLADSLEELKAAMLGGWSILRRVVNAVNPIWYLTGDLPAPSRHHDLPKMTCQHHCSCPSLLSLPASGSR
jgi:hypothetical protein